MPSFDLYTVTGGMSPNEIGNALSGTYETHYRELPPDGFNWPQDLPSVVAYRNGDSFSCNIKPEDLIDFSVFTNTQYVDINRPDSSGDGTSWASAEKGIGQAIENAIASGQPTRIFVKGGIYWRAYGICHTSSPKTLAAPITIEAVYGDVICGSFDDHTYEVNGTYSNVYQTTRSAVSNVINIDVIDSRGNPILYKKVSTLADCANKQGSWYTDGTTTYINDINGAKVSNNSTKILLTARSIDIQGNHDVYISGVTSLGGSSGAMRFADGTSNTVIMNRCKALFAGSSSTTIDGVTILDCNLFAAFNSEASKNAKDGFNLHQNNGKKPTGLFVNCSGYDNGTNPTSVSNNGITCHDGIKCVDIGGDWRGSIGTNAGHVNNDTQVWHFGSIAGDSEGDIYNGGSIGFGGFGAWMGSAEVWLDSCRDVNTSTGIYASGGGTIYYRRHSGTGDKSGNTQPY